MALYLLRRLLLSIPTLFVVSLIIFSLVRIIPGDAVLARIEENSFVPPEALEQMREELGLNEHPVPQYFKWVGGVLIGDFGKSLRTEDPVLPTIKKRMGVSIEIALMAMAIAIVIAVPLGVIAAVKQNTKVDYASRLFAILGLSIPEFWLGTMLLLFLSLQVGWLPRFGWFEPWEHPKENFLALIFPALIVGYRLSAVSARMTRSAMLEVLREDYIRTARAKGLEEWSVVMRHALRNSLIPVITIFGTQISFLLGGLVIIEQIFSLPGMGRYMFDSVIARDYTAVQGAVLVMAVVFIAVNLVIDVLYSYIDPRIRYA